MPRRERRSFTPEFKARTVELIESSGKSMAEVCRELDLTQSAVRHWVELARVDRWATLSRSSTTTTRTSSGTSGVAERSIQRQRSIRHGGGMFRKSSAPHLSRWEQMGQSPCGMGSPIADSNR